MPAARPLVATSVTYFSEGDEAAFFDWLDRIGCVGTVWGAGHDLFIPLARPSNLELRELLALFHRYNVDMRQLARFANDRRKWFSDPIAYWRAAVFGSPPAS